MTRRDFDYGVGRMMPCSYSNEECDNYDRPRGTWPRDEKRIEEKQTSEGKQINADHQGQTKEAA